MPASPTMALSDRLYMPTAAEAKVLEKIKEIVGPKGWTSDPARMEANLIEYRGLFLGRAQMVVTPGSVDEVSGVLALCNEAGIPVVPQGGNTSLCGGSVPFEAGNEIVLSLARMNKIRSIDPLGYTMTVEAGCVLQFLQEEAAKADRYFPLSLAAAGSCMIGGNLSTNAGGTNVLRYGNTRDLALGLEVVLPDGRIWNGLGNLRKDNTGYDLKHLFVGAEGTLGIITAAVVKLFPKPRDMRTAFCAIRDVDAAIELLQRARAESGDSVETLELIPRLALDLVLKHMPDCQDPLDTRYEMYALIELVTTSDSDTGIEERFEAILGAAMEDGLILDAALAQNEQQRQELWKLRENASESQKMEGASIKHDVSVPIASLSAFYEAAAEAIRKIDKKARIVAFGHVGDGNLHYNVSEPEGGDSKAFINRWEEYNRAVHDVVVSFGGSISAEHGIGRLKREELAHYKDPVALDLMRTLKAAIDPNGIMNPGKVI